jgi:hypothetical protein
VFDEMPPARERVVGPQFRRRTQSAFNMAIGNCRFVHVDHVCVSGRGTTSASRGGGRRSVPHLACGCRRPPRPGGVRDGLRGPWLMVAPEVGRGASRRPSMVHTSPPLSVEALAPSLPPSRGPRAVATAGEIQRRPWQRLEPSGQRPRPAADLGRGEARDALWWRELELGDGHWHGTPRKCSMKCP